jgi:methylglyoxal synthase
MRLASVYDIPMALNRATAEVLVQKRGLLRDDAAENTLTAPRVLSDTQRSQ